MRQQCCSCQKYKVILGSINSILSESQEMIVIFYTALSRICPVLVVIVEEGCRGTGRNGEEAKSYGYWLKELGMFSLNKRWLRENMVTVFKFLKGCHREDSLDLCFRASEVRKIANKWKLYRERSKFKIKISWSWGQLNSEAASWNHGAISLEIFSQTAICLRLWDSFPG